MFNVLLPTQSAIPLRSISAIVMDTETTGLDVAADRIVQVGAVRLVGGRVDPADMFDELINPGVPISARSTEIHGIGDEDVEQAAGFADVMPAFLAWAGESVVLGYSIGFDLGILKAEHERVGLAWRPPRSLDVAHLVQLLSPKLPSMALDPVAAWLGVEVRDRHRALGDALLTAEVYLAILPKLRASGISTLAEAERACSVLTSRIDDETRAGWHGAAAPRKAAGHARIDSFPYRHRLSDVMRSPPIVMTNDMTAGDALRRMMEHQVSSVFLPPLQEEGDQENGDHGILTERDLLRAIDEAGADALKEPVGTFATRPLATLDQRDFVYRAISFMTARGFRHLGVRDERGAIVGALSARDLLKQRAGEAIDLGDHIGKATSAADLGRIWGGLAAVVGTLAAEEVDVRDIAAIISGELQNLTRRACEIAEREMTAGGQGGPPAAYAMLVLGSGGRGESLLAMDQDNAIIYREGEPGDETDQWFETLGERVAEILDQAGVAYCKGGVMASKPAWRKDMSHWRKTIADWLRVSSPENILSADIFFDGRPVHGERELGDLLMRDALDAAGRSQPFLGALASHAADFEAPLGWFGRFKLEDGRVDLKKGGLMALFSTARVLALRFGLRERSTRDRYLAAKDHLEHGGEAIGNLIEAHRIILETILRQQLRDLDEGIPLSNRISPTGLTGLQVQNLKWALDQIPHTENLLGTPARL